MGMGNGLGPLTPPGFHMNVPQHTVLCQPASLPATTHEYGYNNSSQQTGHPLPTQRQ